MLTIVASLPQDITDFGDKNYKMANIFYAVKRLKEGICSDPDKWLMQY